MEPSLPVSRRPPTTRDTDTGGRAPHHRFWRPAILAIGLAISVAVAGVVHDMLSQEAAAQRAIARQSLAAGLQSHIDRQLGFLRFLRGLYESSDFVSQSEFQRFIEIDPTMRERPWWLTLAWAARYPGATDTGAVAPPSGIGDGDVFSLTYVAPTRDLGSPLPDAAADTLDRAAMAKALALQHIAVTTPHVETLNGAETTVIKAFTPVFKAGTDGSAGILQGFLIETIGVDGFFKNFLGDAFDATDLTVRLYDGPGLVFASGVASDVAVPIELTVGDRKWRLEVDGKGQAIDTGIWLPALVFVTGLALTILLYLRLLRADTEYRRIAGEVRYATAELAQANQGLVERSAKLQQAADDLRRTSHEAQLANAAKTMFLANMSHELRTPLNAVVGFSEMIARRTLGESSPRYFEYATDISASGRYLLSIIEDLLDMSRIELGKLQLKDGVVALADLVEDVAKFVSLRAFDKRIELRRDGIDKLPQVLVDPKAIRQALINLLTNAVKFSGTGTRVEIRGALEPAGVALSVTDQGIGIRKEDLEHIFEPFWQAEAYRSKNREGIGLGLAITRRLIEAHGGTIAIESREGEGTAVTIHLPASRIVRGRPQLSVVQGGAGGNAA